MGALAAEAGCGDGHHLYMLTLADFDTFKGRISARAARFACGLSPRKTRPGNPKRTRQLRGDRASPHDAKASDDAGRERDATLSQTDRLPPKDRDDLNNGAMIQPGFRPAQQPRRGVSADRAILDDQRNFKINNPDAQNQLEEMLARLAAIRDQNLGPAEQGLSRATKSLDAKNAPSAGSPPPAGAQRNGTEADRQTLASQNPPKPRSGNRPSRPGSLAESNPPASKKSTDAVKEHNPRDDAGNAAARAVMHRKEAIKRGMHRREQRAGQVTGKGFEARSAIDLAVETRRGDATRTRAR